MSKNKETLTIVVNGVPIEVEVNVNSPLHTVVPKALQQSGNIGQPVENWELRDADGKLLDTNQKIEDFGFTDTTKLFLSLKAGIGG